VLLFPNFQRSSGFLSLPLFQAECKGRGLHFILQIFLLLFEVYFQVYTIYVASGQTITAKGSIPIRRLRKYQWPGSPKSGFRHGKEGGNEGNL
jgi:hypothetical protein